jgi:hypothetical protein
MHMQTFMQILGHHFRAHYLGDYCTSFFYLRTSRPPRTCLTLKIMLAVDIRYAN